MAAKGRFGLSIKARLAAWAAAHAKIFQLAVWR